MSRRLTGSLLLGCSLLLLGCRSRTEPQPEALKGEPVPELKTVTLQVKDMHELLDLF